MPKVIQVGKKSLDFYGKYLAEISKNLSDRGVGRMVVKESELRNFSEPSFYILKEVDLLMSDQSHRRCRVLAHRFFRGRDIGVVGVKEVYQPDWRLLTPVEAEEMMEKLSRSKPVQFKEKNVVFSVPPTLSLFLKNSEHIPEELKNKISFSNPLLMKAKLTDDPLLFELEKKPTDSQIAMMYPISHQNNETNKFRPYYIKRSDTPGVHWKVELEPDNRDEILKNIDKY